MGLTSDKLPPTKVIFKPKAPYNPPFIRDLPGRSSTPATALCNFVPYLGHSTYFAPGIVEFTANKPDTVIERIVDFLVPTQTTAERITVGGDFPAGVRGPGIVPTSRRKNRIDMNIHIVFIFDRFRVVE